MVHDVAIIGAGVVGCAMARRFARAGARVLLLERGADILSGASKANSAILHTGFDAPPDSLELRCMQAGYQEYLTIRHAMNLPLLDTTALVLAWSEAEAARLPDILAQAHRNGVADARALTRAEVLAREPQLAASVHAGLLIPGEAVIDPWSAPLAYATEALRHGATLRFGATVQAARFDGAAWLIDTTRGRFGARLVINCAGTHGDHIEALFLGQSHFTISPRKGQFVVYDKAAAALLGAIVLPVPDDRTKGVVLTRTIFGNLLVGPTAEDQPDRDRATVDPDALTALMQRAETMIPALKNMPVTAVYAGLRPASDAKHYRIRAEPGRGFITVGGIRSTGLTAALGIAAHVFELCALPDTAPPPQPPPRMPNLAEHLPRDWQDPGYGEIVCHCELVTRREIEAALHADLPPGDFGGLRRRTRCAMGRCQGFGCHARLAELTAGHLTPPLALPRERRNG